MSLLQGLRGHIGQPEPPRPPRDVTTSTQSDDLLDVVGILHTMDRINQKSRLGTDYIHSTALKDTCVRLWKLNDMFELGSDGGSNSSSDRVLWATGRALEHHVRTQIIGAIPEKTWGDWSCQCGHITLRGAFGDEIVLSATCWKCGSPTTTYCEHTVYDHDRKVAGNPDLILQDRDKLRVYEIKSTNETDYYKMKGKPKRKSSPATEGTGRPLPDHSAQALGYVRMLKEEVGVDRVHELPHILYVRKEYKWDSPYFITPAQIGEDSSVDRMLDTAEAIKLAREEEGLPARHKQCLEPTSPRAKGCAGCSLCFSFPE